MNPPLEYCGEEMLLMEGILSELFVAETTVNVLEQIQKRSRKKNLAIGVAASLSGMHGVVATSAALALYEGEDMHNFACFLGDKVLCGTFKDADKLRANDPIVAVVSKRGGVYFAHSLRRTSDDLFMLPLNAVRGSDALFRSCMQVAWNLTRTLWVIIGLILYMFNEVETPGRPLPWFFVIFTLVVPPMILFPMEWWTYQTMDSASDYADAIFKVYEIPRPESFDATKEQTSFEQFGNFFNAPNYRTALSEHKRKFGIQE